MTLVEKLHACAAADRSASNQHWEDEARQLMRWAANTIEAAAVIINEQSDNKSRGDHE